MEKNPQENSTSGTHDNASQRTRRDFFLTAAGACGAIALWSLHHPLLTPVEARRSHADAGPVTVIQFSANGKRVGEVTIPRVVKSDAEWKQQLTPISFEVARRAGTERAFTGSTWNLHERGLYRCICCDLALFSSDTKFESGTGWPSFWQPIAKENVVEANDFSFGEVRKAISCRECDAHLGHVFDDGPPPTGLRYCMNSASMRFVKLT